MTIMTSCEITSPRQAMSREEALLLSDEGKRLYFRQVRLKHPRVTEVLDDMTALTMPDSGTGIVLLIGPTGVGKSTLVSALGERILKSKRADMEADPGFVPVAMMNAPASGERGFSWRMFHFRLGEALDEPLMNRKLETMNKGGRALVRLPGSGSTLTAMCLSTERTLANRRTMLVVIDEAVHMLRKAKGNDIANHMDALKSLADLGPVFALVGSYDLLQFTKLSGQVARRVGLVHFGRYLTGVREDERAFRTAIRQLQSMMPIRGMPDLADMSNDLHMACLGCVGILKNTLAKALAKTLQAGGKWSDSHLQKSLLSEDQFHTILSETMEGEALIRNSTIGSGSFESLAARAKAIAAAARDPR